MQISTTCERISPLGIAGLARPTTTRTLPCATFHINRGWHGYEVVARNSSLAVKRGAFRGCHNRGECRVERTVVKVRCPECTEKYSQALYRAHAAQKRGAKLRITATFIWLQTDECHVIMNKGWRATAPTPGTTHRSIPQRSDSVLQASVLPKAGDKSAGFGTAPAALVTATRLVTRCFLANLVVGRNTVVGMFHSAGMRPAGHAGRSG